MIQIYNSRQPPMVNPTNYQEPNFKRQTRSDYAGLNHFFLQLQNQAQQTTDHFCS